MTLGSKEHYELMEQFEKQFKEKPAREPKYLWPKGHFYANGEINREFIAYRQGYSFAKCVYQR